MSHFIVSIFGIPTERSPSDWLLQNSQSESSHSVELDTNENSVCEVCFLATTGAGRVLSDWRTGELPAWVQFIRSSDKERFCPHGPPCMDPNHLAQPARIVPSSQSFRLYALNAS